MRLALATRFREDRPERPALPELARTGARALALSPGLLPRTLAQLRRERRRIYAVWIYAAHPDALKPGEDAPSLLPLITPDREMRGRALAEAAKALTLAAELEAPLVVAPLGRPPANAPRRVSLDAARASLDALLEEAARRSLLLAVPTAEEGPPDESELKSLLSEFSGAPLRYWHRAAYSEPAPPPEPPGETKTPGGLILLIPPSEPPPPPKPPPPLPEALAADCGGAEATFGPPDREREEWPEGDFARRLGEALGERPLVYQPDPRLSEEEVERALLRLG